MKRDVRDVRSGPARRPPDADAIARAERAHTEAAAAIREDADRPLDPKDVAVFVAVARERFARPRSVRPLWLALPAAAAVAAILLLVFTLGSEDAETIAPRSADLLTLTVASDATVVAPGGASRTARAGASVPAPSLLRTGSAGSAVLEDERTATVTLSSDTEVRVAAWTNDEAVLELEEGAVRSAVRKRRAGERYEVRTPYAVVRVVGTDFTVRHAAGEVTEIETFEGRVQVETLDGRPLGTVDAGDTLRVAPPQPVAETTPASAEEPTDEATAPADEVAAPAAPPKAPPTAPATSEAVAEAAGEESPPEGVAVEQVAVEVAVEEAAPPAPARKRTRKHRRRATPPPRHHLELGHDAPPSDRRPPPARGELDAPPPGGFDLGGPVPPPPSRGMEFGAPPPPHPSGSPDGEWPGDAPPPPPMPMPVAEPATPPPEPTAEEIVRAARDLLAAGDDARAIATLEAAAGRSWRVRATLGDAYRVAGRGADAQAAYEKALAEAGAPPPEPLLADLASLVGDRDPAAAAPFWRRYLDAHPSGPAAPAALWALADAANAEGDRDDARDFLETLVEDHPRSRHATRALVRLGRMLLTDGDWDAAEALFLAHRGDEQRARSEAALVGLLRVRIEQRRFEDARRLVAEHGERFPHGRRAAEVRHLAAALPSAPSR